MKRNYVAAALVAGAFALWLISGQFNDDLDVGPAPPLAADRDAVLAMQQDTPTRVRARTIRAETQTADVVVRGRTEADRVVELKAETSGRIVELRADKGDVVAAGDLICRIDTEDRAARVRQAEEEVKRAKIEFDGFSKLSERGFQSETAIARARAELAAARADLETRRLDLARTEIRAPFDGVVEDRPPELGDLLQVGSICATVIDPDPLLLTGQVAEREVGRIDLGTAAEGQLITGETARGTVTFIARTPNPNTRTYRIELEVPNPDNRYRAGITTEIRIPVETIRGHRIPASLLALDDRGDVGVRIVDEENVVQFVYVDIIKDTPQGLWVAGLPEVTTLITVGQEMVVPGETVEVSLEAAGDLPAIAPADDDLPEGEVIAEPGTSARNGVSVSTDGGPVLSATG